MIKKGVLVSLVKSLQSHVIWLVGLRVYIEAN